MSYQPIKSWRFANGKESVTVSESLWPDQVDLEIHIDSETMLKTSLTREQFEALCLLGQGYPGSGNYVRFRSPPEPEEDLHAILREPREEGPSE